MAQSKLLKLTTDLKSLGYGNSSSSPNPGSQPYITFPIGYTKSFEVNDPIPQSISDYYISNRTSLDFPLRGGSIDFDLSTRTFTQASKIDKERIKKFLKDSPRGPMFIRKQIGLQLSNPKIETDSILPGLSNTSFPNILENTRVYNNGINTLEQVGVQGTGMHLVRHGTLPLNPYQKTYYDIVNKQNIDNSYATNRLVALKNIKLVGVSDENSRITATKTGIALSSRNILQYIGGPESVYGIGSTTIRRYDYTDQGTTNAKFNGTAPSETIAVGLQSNAYAALVYRDYKQISEQQGTVKDGGIVQYRNSERNTLYKIGDPGNRSDVNYNTRTNANGVDAMNKGYLLPFNNDVAPWEGNNGITELDKESTKDIIKFVFEAIDNDKTKESVAIFFRAFLSGISDNHQATINTYKYLGRGEDFYTYQGANRTIQFSFKISPQSEGELRPLYKRLNNLISQVYPDYSEKTGIMRAPLMRITIGDYFHRVAGLIESINITIDDNVPWEINYFNDSQLRQLPQVVNVQCSFKPIQEFLPRREKMSDNNVPYITEYSPTGSNYMSYSRPNLNTNQNNAIPSPTTQNIISTPSFSQSDIDINNRFRSSRRGAVVVEQVNSSYKIGE